MKNFNKIRRLEKFLFRYENLSLIHFENYLLADCHIQAKNCLNRVKMYDNKAKFYNEKILNLLGV